MRASPRLFLRRKTIWEACFAPGIPSYRLPVDTLDREVSYILRHGVTVYTGRKVDGEELARLGQGYDAVLLATGQQNKQPLSSLRSASEQVIQGIDFLNQVRHQTSPLSGLRVVVLGGGNTAVDAARAAIRLGAKEVRILYRRLREQMRASAEEWPKRPRKGSRSNPVRSPIGFASAGVGASLLCRRTTREDLDGFGNGSPEPERGE